jgi:hypothetical protein
VARALEDGDAPPDAGSDTARGSVAEVALRRLPSCTFSARRLAAPGELGRVLRPAGSQTRSPNCADAFAGRSPRPAEVGSSPPPDPRSYAASGWSDHALPGITGRRAESCPRLAGANAPLVDRQATVARPRDRRQLADSDGRC